MLTATEQGPTYAPTFTGNGELGVRVPADGQGSGPAAIPTLSELAGFYAEPAGQVQQRANIPTWSTLTFADDGQDFDAWRRADQPMAPVDRSEDGIYYHPPLWRSGNGHLTELTL